MRWASAPEGSFCSGRNIYRASIKSVTIASHELAISHYDVFHVQDRDQVSADYSDNHVLCVRLLIRTDRTQAHAGDSSPSSIFTRIIFPTFHAGHGQSAAFCYASRSRSKSSGTRLRYQRQLASCAGQKWWTDTPVNETLNVPGWSAADAKHMADIKVDLHITPDGRYAVALAGARWMEKSDFIFHAPMGYVARKPDTIITVIDLNQWKIINSVHTSSMTEGELRGVRVLSGKWLVLDFSLGNSPLRILSYRYITKLITIPELHSGYECTSDRPFRGSTTVSLKNEEAEPAKKHNNEVCRSLLQVVRIGSVDDMEIQIERGQDVLPDVVQQRSHDLVDTEDDFFRHWGEYPYYLLYSENPPFESSSHRWYGLYESQERGFYDLEIYDAEGRKQKAQTMRHLMCGDSSLEQRGSACGCRAIDVSEEQHDLLSYCRTQHGDFDGMLRREWLAILHTDDLSGAGFINLSSKYHHETLEEIAIGDNHPYVATLEFGETLRVYAIPDQP